MLERKVENCLTHLTISPVTATYLRTLCLSHVAASKTIPTGKWIPKWLIEKEHLTLSEGCSADSESMGFVDRGSNSRAAIYSCVIFKQVA